MGLHQFPVKEGSPTKPAPGWNLQVVDETTRWQSRRDRRPGGQAAAAAGTLPTLWQNDERYKESYLEEFPGYYKTADAGSSMKTATPTS
jgi:propionyl-CoA synthetase